MTLQVILDKAIEIIPNAQKEAYLYMMVKTVQAVKADYNVFKDIRQR